MDVLITGGAGYLGAVLVEELLHTTLHKITVMDNFQHGVPSLSALCQRSNLNIIRGNVCNSGLLTHALNRQQAVVSLAAVVGARACDNYPAEAAAVNLRAIEQLQQLLPRGVLLIYPCTNSGYGTGGETLCDETSLLQPLSLYGRTKVAAESVVLQHPRGVSLRLATLFGASPRMRLDLMVNDFVYHAVHEGTLKLFEGHFRRNFLHVRDAARAIIQALRGDLRWGEAYNVGDDRANMTKRQLCERIQQQVPGFHWEDTHGTDPDQRDYVVSNAKIHAAGWRPLRSLDEGIAELIRCYAQPFESGRAWRNA